MLVFCSTCELWQLVLELCRALELKLELVILELVMLELVMLELIMLELVMLELVMLELC